MEAKEKVSSSFSEDCASRDPLVAKPAKMTARRTVNRFAGRKNDFFIVEYWLFIQN
jgi:hypothetical protein